MHRHPLYGYRGFAPLCALALLWGGLGGNRISLAAEAATLGAEQTVPVVEGPRFSPERGFFDSSFLLQLNASPGAAIRFTVDGSAPSESAGQVYSAPISIDRSTVVRAVAYQSGDGASDVVTHTFIFPQQAVTQPRNPDGFPLSWAGIGADYEMDSRITVPYADRMLESLRSLPSLFITTSLSNLFDAANGIYSNPEQHGIEWERPASIELVNLDGSTEVQANCGLRIQGGHFRGRSTTQKHSFRVLFKRLYGPGKLRYRLFKEATAVDEFDTLVLRAGANDGYSWADAKDTEQFIRDEFGRMIQREMGHPSPHGRFVHLYLNGLYWGLYNLCERPNEDFSESYFGGTPEEWDAVNAGDVKNGDLDAWNRFVTLAGRVGSYADYQMLQGKAMDGSRNRNFPVYFDPVNYIDYMIVNIWGGNWDWPNKNFWFGRRRIQESTGFKFYVWDFENTMGNNRARSPLEMVAPRASIASSWVGQPHASLKIFAEYRMDFADRVQRYFFDGGILTPQLLAERYRELAAQVELGIIAESARWGDDHLNPPQDLADWQRERDWMLNTYLPQRSGIVLQQFRSAGLYPTLDAPRFNQKGGAVPAGFEVRLSAPNGEVYYTTDGTDPRARGVSSPAVSASARSFADGIPIAVPTTVKARVFDGTQWSALSEASFVIDAPSAGGLRVISVSALQGQLDLTFTSTPGASYAVQTAEELSSPEWRDSLVIPADPNADRTRVSISINARQRFFRVVRQ